ncbi:uncharacterized protein LOC134233315 [Saccostrea cucullata]|uniref:uncharacterized protein LOC134233315 n=1 Tax=Saccostrea cuccullata TaxID=36930 RepID=UPI002ED5E99A
MSIRRKIFCFGVVDALLASISTYKLADYIYCREPDPSFLETILQTLGLQKVPEPVCPTSYGVLLVVVGWIVLQIIVVVFYRKKSVVKDTMAQSVQNFISDTSDVPVASPILPIDTIGAHENVKAIVSEVNEVTSVDIGNVDENVIERSSISEGTVFFSEVASVDIGNVEIKAIESVSEGKIFFNEIESVDIGSVEKNAIERISVSEGMIFFE